MINHALRTLASVSFIEETVVYASDDEVMRHVDATIENVRFVRRASRLDSDETSAQDFIRGFLNEVPADIVVLLHATSPFISATTVARCVDAVAAGSHDSAFAALEMQRFAWFRGSPLNYKPSESIPRTQDLEPVTVEQSGLYVFTRTLFEKEERRIGDTPLIAIVDEIEGHDIDTLAEFRLAECLMEIQVE